MSYIAQGETLKQTIARLKREEQRKSAAARATRRAAPGRAFSPGRGQGFTARPKRSAGPGGRPAPGPAAESRPTVIPGGGGGSGGGGGGSGGGGGTPTPGRPADMIDEADVEVTDLPGEPGGEEGEAEPGEATEPEAEPGGEPSDEAAEAAPEATSGFGGVLSSPLGLLGVGLGLGWLLWGRKGRRRR